MSTQLSQDIESASPMVFAHPSLHEYLDANEMWMMTFARSYQIEFADYDELVSRGDVSGAPIMLPVNAEYQAESLRSIRARHAVGLIVAVTNDVTGHSTYFAIRSGANFVINVAIPGERQAEMICSQMRESTRHASKSPRPTVRGSSTTKPHIELGHPPKLGEAPSPEGPTSLGADSSRKMLSESDVRLLGLLRSSMTVAEIARLNYVSERSMYRRIRSLYDMVGVASRTQLMGSTAGTLLPAGSALPI
ncbi:helix-turn-helix transcriptional regulator [Nocardia goodfellowii]